MLPLFCAALMSAVVSGRLTTKGLSNAGIAPDADHSFMIQLYEGYLEVDISVESDGQELPYAVIITEEDCKSKYKIVSLDLLLSTIRDAVREFHLIPRDRCLMNIARLLTN